MDLGFLAVIVRVGPTSHSFVLRVPSPVSTSRMSGKTIRTSKRSDPRGIGEYFADFMGSDGCTLAG